MFKSWWQRLLNNQRSSVSVARRRRERPRNQVRLQLEHLEDRLTPSVVNISASVSGTILTIKKVSGDDSITITAGAAFGELTVSVPGPNTINRSGQTFNTTGAVTTVVVKLGNGTDSLTFDGTTATGNGPINLSGGLTISGTGGDKTLALTTVNLLDDADLNIALTGSGTETSTFTGVNVAGAASISHPGAGDTSVTIAAPAPAGPNAVFNWGSLTINNGKGFDSNAVGDTNFAGNVTINNGPGSPGDTSLQGGSLTNISAANDQNLANIGGNLMVTTASGESATELYDYNVHGNVNINTGTGIAGQQNPNFVGLENIQTVATSGIPVILGNVNITGNANAITGVPGLVVDAGTDVQDPNGGAAADLPLTILGSLGIHVTGSGAASITLNDLNVPKGSTIVTLGGSTKNNTLVVQAGTGLTSVYQGFTLTSNATGGNTVSIQDQAGTIQFGGAVNLTFNTGNTTVNVGADVSNDTGVTNALVELFGATTVKGRKGGSNSFFGAPGKVPNSNILFITAPDVSNFTLS